MMNYIVLDLEWNQSAGGKQETVEDMPFEIVEIGAVKLDRDFRMVSTFHRMIKPRVYQRIHFKISEVTHMTMEELNNHGEDFEMVIHDFFQWCGSEYTFGTWGTMDLTELQRNIRHYGIPIPFPKPLFYYDIQKLYSLLYGDGKQKCSLDQAVAEMEICQDRPFHRALDDAYYTAKVFGLIDFERIKEYISTDYYRIPDNKSEEIYLQFTDYSKYVSRGFKNREEAMADKKVCSMICYRCGRALRKKLRWFTPNQKQYYGLAICPDHGYLKGKIRIKKADDGSTYVVKTMKLVSEEDAGVVRGRLEDFSRRKKDKNKAGKC